MQRKQRVSMRKIREILRLGFVMSLSCRQVARSAGVSRPTVAFYLDRFQQSGKSAQDLMALDDNKINNRTTRAYVLEKLENIMKTV